ncbi:hypothetical protein GTU73_06490 [Rathayibacter sp. VKM Ac-2804]|jgi:hypothetical protein|uniref:hypothetical protein n=1 Tax=unclassified Rathayibacter TaxID=2609250 RepID=UPI00132EE6EA|nr:MULTISPECIES: hypothetical protein [unclassified Rathayibacter]NRG40062.1 hypothetical protein [Rathayibacter sp. VKM Ac-2835]QHF23697.1 hypothetical protein GTU73_06490 [Rathayibacter sp. VKM Ac-2804]
MVTAAAMLIGLFAGLLVGRGRAPRRRPGFLMAGCGLLAVLIGILALEAFALGNALLAGVAATLGATAYAASVWKRRIPDPEISWAGWAWRELIHPRYVREQFEQVGRR